MTPLGSIFKYGASKPPKIDQHSLFTSIQVSEAVLHGTLQVRLLQSFLKYSENYSQLFKGF